MTVQRMLILMRKTNLPKMDISRPAFSHRHPAFWNKCRSVPRKHFLETLCQQPAAHLLREKRRCVRQKTVHTALLVTSLL